MRPDAIRGLVALHGGIRVVRTHRVWVFDRRTGGRVQRWANTIECHDGWTRTLTTTEERALTELPEELRAVQHVVEA